MADFGGCYDKRLYSAPRALSSRVKRRGRDCAPALSRIAARPGTTLTSLKLGEGGIRTLGTLLGYGALAKRCFRPLSHLTNCFVEVA